MELDDTQLRIISDELDIKLQSICIEHNMPPLSVGAIVLARIIRLNDIVGDSQDLGKLLLSVGNSILNKELEKPGNIH